METSHVRQALILEWVANRSKVKKRIPDPESPSVRVLLDRQAVVHLIDTQNL